MPIENFPGPGASAPMEEIKNEDVKQRGVSEMNCTGEPTKPGNVDFKRTYTPSPEIKSGDKIRMFFPTLAGLGSGFRGLSHSGGKWIGKSLND